MKAEVKKRTRKSFAKISWQVEDEPVKAENLADGTFEIYLTYPSANEPVESIWKREPRKVTGEPSVCVEAPSLREEWRCVCITVPELATMWRSV